MRNIYVETRSGAYIVKLSRSEKLNAINSDMWIDIRRCFNEACWDKDRYKGIIITGSGRAFSSGDDIYEMYRLKSHEESIEFFKNVFSTMKTIASCPKPVVAAVNGLAVGGGAEILFIVDAVVAVKDSWFSFPEGLIGLIPPILLTIGSNHFGFRKARYLALTGERISSSEAHKLGIVDIIIDDESKLIDKSIEVIHKISKVPINTRIEIKRFTILRYLDLLEDAIHSLSKLAASSESKELMKRFIES